MNNSARLQSAANRFAAQHQQRCQRLPLANLSRCGNLAAAHTGSTSLWEWLCAADAPLAQHNHATSYEHLRFARARCILFTLRDPARRFESSFTFEASHWHDLWRKINDPKAAPGLQWMFNLALGRPLISRHTGNASTTTTPKEWLAAFRTPAHALHRTVQGVFRASQALRPQGWPPFRSQADRFETWNGAAGAAFRAWGGSHSLVPQAAYLMEANEDISSALAEHVHLICVDRFSEDTRELSFGCKPTNSMDASHRHHAPHANKAGCPGCRRDAGFGAGAYKARAALSETDERFVRECLYPADWALWQSVCARRVEPLEKSS